MLLRDSNKNEKENQTKAPQKNANKKVLLEGISLLIKNVKKSNEKGSPLGVSFLGGFIFFVFTFWKKIISVNLFSFGRYRSPRKSP